MMLTQARTLVDTHFLVWTGTAVQGIMELSRARGDQSAPPEVAAALDAIGDDSGETWLHLLGLCLELEPPASFEQLVDHIGAMEAMRFRRVLLGLTAWSWRSIVGAETIEAAARGDEVAAERLLGDDRYYGQAAGAALRKILPLDAAETRSRFLGAMEAYRTSVDAETLTGRLQAAAAEVQALADSEGWIDAIEEVAGYTYVAEPEARRVAVMPHLAGPGLTLTQHEETRLIVYGATPPPEEHDRLVELGKALADPTRIQILSALAGADLPLGELVELTELTRSTVHHHLKQLRAIGLVSVEGNARSYRYQISDRGRSRALDELARLLSARKETS